MTPQDLSSIIGDVQIATIKGHCHSCKEPVAVVIARTSETEMKISGGALFQPPASWDMGDDLVCKCDSCYEKQSEIHRPCLVYSRVTGYYSPTKQWSNAKQNEFQIRKTFRTSKFLDNN